MSRKRDDLSGDAAALPLSKEPQCPRVVRLDSLGESVRCIRDRGHDGDHLFDLVNRP